LPSLAWGFGTTNSSSIWIPEVGPGTGFRAPTPRRCGPPHFFLKKKITLRGCTTNLASKGILVLSGGLTHHPNEARTVGKRRAGVSRQKSRPGCAVRCEVNRRSCRETRAAGCRSLRVRGSLPTGVHWSVLAPTGVRPCQCAELTPGDCVPRAQAYAGNHGTERSKRGRGTACKAGLRQVSVALSL